MQIEIVTPAAAGSTTGNRITAERWAKILRGLGHRVSISPRHDGSSPDILVALHARRSHSSVLRFRRDHPQTPLVLALTGTDVYRDLQRNGRARKSLDLADRIIVLQPHALRELTAKERKKARVIYQSVEPVPIRQKPHRVAVGNHFDVCVVGHLRAVKDPFRAAMAARRLPNYSRVRINQVGRALSKPMERRALREMQINKRYRWLGELSRARALRVIAQSRLCVISSRMEGGANVLSEAIVAGVPALASRIDGNVGIVGENYPGLFRLGGTGELRKLLRRAEADPKFLKDLGRRIKRLAPLFNPLREKRAWAVLLTEL